MLNPTPTSEISLPDEKALLDEEALLDKEALLAINLFIKKTGERKVDVESLKKLEYSQKQEKAEELTQEIDYIKTQTQKLFGGLRNKIKQLIPQIIAQTEKEKITAEALKEFSTTITEIITKIEEEYSKKPEEFAQDKNPIEGIITKILEGDTEVDPQFKQLFLYDPDSTKKILTQILKETVIKKIITEIKEEVSIDSQTEERETDSFGKIITRIKQEDSLINKYYEEDPVSILKIIARLEFEKADENPIEKIINQILEEKEKARQAITQDPLGQIFIAHEKETSAKILSEIEKVNSPTFKVGVEEVVVTGEDVNTKIHSHISQEIVEKNIFEKDLDGSSEIKIKSQPTKKTSFISGLFSTRTPKNREKFDTAVPNTTGIESDMVFVELYAPTEEEIRKTVIKEQNIKLIQKIKELAEKQAQEELAEKDEKGRSLDVKKLLIYAELIAKIPKEYSESISPTHQEIIYLKKQEKGHKKTLNFLKELIQEEEIIAEKKRIAKEITQQEKILGEIAKDIAEERKLYFEEQERIDAEKIAKISVEEIRRDFEDQISEAKKLNLQEQKKQITKTLTTNSQSLIKTKTDIDRKVREILSSEYVDEKLPSVSGESTMEQLLIEAILVDEARKKLNPDEIKEIESKLKPESPDSTSSEIDKKALNLLIIQKALEKILKLEQQKNNSDYLLNDDSEIIVPAIENIDTPQNKLNFFKPNNKLNLDALALLESKEQSKALEERLAEINALEEKIAPPASELSSPKPENALGVVEQPSDKMKPDNYRSYETHHIMNEEDNSPQPDKILSAGGDFAQVRVEEESPLITAESDLRLPSSQNHYQSELNPQFAENSGNLRSAPPIILDAQEERNDFLLNFICTRSRKKSPRNDADSFSQEDEIEKRRIGLYTILDTILKTNLEKQITKESNPISKNEEEIDAKTAENNIETVMDYIATYTSNLASSISKNENKQTGETLQSEASDPQTTQNFSTEDPIIYSGIGIRIKLENENGEYFLRITEVFENSDLKDEDVNKKITHIKCGDDFKSIGEIHRECGGDDEKFYTKIALIFRDENQKTLSLKIEGEEKTVEKKIFIPEDKTVLNVTNNSQMTKIADKLRASRQNFSQLTTFTRGERTNSLTNPI